MQTIDGYKVPDGARGVAGKDVIRRMEIACDEPYSNCRSIVCGECLFAVPAGDLPDKQKVAFLKWEAQQDNNPENAGQLLDQYRERTMKLQEALAEAERDTARLDQLERLNPTIERYAEGGVSLFVWDADGDEILLGSGRNLREAIDATQNAPYGSGMSGQGPGCSGDDLTPSGRPESV